MDVNTLFLLESFLVPYANMIPPTMHIHASAITGLCSFCLFLCGSYELQWGGEGGGGNQVCTITQWKFHLIVTQILFLSPNLNSSLCS